VPITAPAVRQQMTRAPRPMPFVSRDIAPQRRSA
jgi:hypothetical protein